MTKKTSFKYIIITTILGVILYKALFSDREKYELGVLVGSKVPDFELATIIDNNKFTNNNILEINKEYKLLNFFASWCSTCMMEHDDMMSLTMRDDIEVIGVLWRDNPTTVENWLNEHGDPYDLLLMDKRGSSKTIFGLIGVPESFLIDKGNNIIAHYRGPINLKQIEEFLENKISLVQ